ASTKILRAAYAGAEFISDGATRWTSISPSAAALTTVAGRLARFIDTAGTVGQTSSLNEDASGRVGIGRTATSDALEVAGNIT
ncbi:hypothetical protein, partial [Citrobacter freundii]|uniref:hypothetical protein n=1 Tax=Citrobacter freundii TaxID=546 RepID=UPI0013D60C0E